MVRHPISPPCLLSPCAVWSQSRRGSSCWWVRPVLVQWRRTTHTLCVVPSTVQIGLIKNRGIQTKHTAKIPSHNHCQCQPHTRFLSSVSYLAPTSSSETIWYYQLPFGGISSISHEPSVQQEIFTKKPASQNDKAGERSIWNLSG